MLYDCQLLDSLPNVDISWSRFLTNSIIQQLQIIEHEISKSQKGFTPGFEKALKFLTIPLNQIKLVILGQDPYPQIGVATGRAFEVGTLKSWNDKFNNISLKNIIRSIYKAYTGKILKYSEIKNEIGTNFNIYPPNELFVKWEKQGVLLLNTSFTCEMGNPNSHQSLWTNFTNALLNYIAQERKDLIWFIWGNNAKFIIQNIPINHKLESMHPMMCYNKPGRDDDFLFGRINPFEQTKDIINWLG